MVIIQNPEIEKHSRRGMGELKEGLDLFHGIPGLKKKKKTLRL